MTTWTATQTGTYRVTATGAQGGHGTNDGQSFVGGRGALIAGSFIISGGDMFYLAVGGEGSSLPGQYNGGGGGGSFFVDLSGNPILVAGGGGGIRSFGQQNGCDASITPYGVAGSGASSASGCLQKVDDLGLGGDASSVSWGSGGAGFYGDGADDAGFGTGGSSWANGMFGGLPLSTFSGICDATGGFGGGGSGNGCGGGGGGGGYSGGDGGFIGGGGGSWNTGFDQFVLAGVGYGNGSITIELLTEPVPEPGSLLLLGSGLLGLTVRRRRTS